MVDLLSQVVRSFLQWPHVALVFWMFFFVYKYVKQMPIGYMTLYPVIVM